MSEYGVRVGSSILVVGDIVDAESWALANVNRDAPEAQIVRIVPVGKIRLGGTYEPASPVCYCCGKLREAPSPHCPKASHP